MHQRTVHRCAAVLALSAALALAGARPAAAQDFDVFERGMRWLAALLDMDTSLARQAPESQTMTSSLNKSGTPGPGTTVVPGDKGLGVDPNGNP
jgi:hypothetical protein